MCSHELKDIQLFKEDGQYYLKLKYIIEHDDRVEELEIPKVKIPFNERYYPEIQTEYHPWSALDKCILFVGCRQPLDILQGDTPEAKDTFYVTRVIEEKPVELTVSEIEKKLGYKIKIVNRD